MPDTELPSQSDRAIPRRARDETQLILSQIHGVVWLAVNEVDTWLERREQKDGSEPELTAEDVRRAAAEIHAHFGTVHAALNTGEYDERLVSVGMTGAQGQAKRKGFLPALGRIFGAKAQAVRTYVTRLRGALRWSGTLLGSITTALNKEIDKVPGAAAAGEAIKEFVELLLNAAEPPEVEQNPPPSQNKGETRVSDRDGR